MSVPELRSDTQAQGLSPSSLDPFPRERWGQGTRQHFLPVEGLRGGGKGSTLIKLLIIDLGSDVEFPFEGEGL